MADNKKTIAAVPKRSLILDFINSHTQAILLVLLVLICLIVFKDFIFFKKIYLFKDIGSDSINMYVPWINCFSDYMQAEGTPGWSFQQGMGQNIFPLWLGDFFSYALMHMDKARIPYYLAHVEAIKIILCGFVFYKFLKELKVSNFVALLFALMYAFSGFVVMGGSWVIYSIEALDVALILYGFERWLNHKKVLWFVVGIALLAFLQPALLLPWTIFLAAYITARYFDVKEASGKGFIIFTAKTIALATLGVFLSSYQLFPDILQIKESPRVSGESAFFEKLQEQSAFDLADPWQRFTLVFRSFGTDMLGNGNNFKGWYNYLEAPLFYCGILCLVLFPLFFTSLNSRQKKVYGIITFLFCLPIVFPYFRYMFWAFSGDYYRTFSLVIVLFLIIYSARALSYIEQTRKVNKIALGITVLLLLILLYTPAAQFKNMVNENMRMLATVLLLAYGAFIFRMGSLSASVSNLKVVLLVIGLLELTIISYGTVNDRGTMRVSELTNRVGYNDYTLDAVKYVKENDKSFYRFNKNYVSGLAMHGSVNDSKAQGYYSTQSYHSFNQMNYIKFLNDFGVINAKDENSTRWAPGLGSRPILFALSAGKYWLTKQTGPTMEQLGYDSIARFGDVKLYRNRLSVPLGVTYNSVVSEDDFKKISPIQKDFIVLRAAVVQTVDAGSFSQFKKFNVADTNVVPTLDNMTLYAGQLKKDSLKITAFSENHITGNITVNEPKILFLSFPMDEGWKATVNNKETKLFIVNAGMTGLILDAGSNNVDLQFTPRYKKEGAVVTIFSILVLAGLVGWDRFKKKKAPAQAAA